MSLYPLSMIDRPFIALCVLILAIGCEKPFDLSTLPDPRSSVLIGDTSYVELAPPIEGFNGPSGLVMGKDQLLYVADTRNNRIVMLNEAGQTMSQRTILQPIAIGMDFRLDLIIGCVILTPGGDSAGAVIRVRLTSTGHNLATAPVDTIWKEVAKPRRRFVGILALPNNDILAVRRGPDNSSFVDPDGRVLRFSAARGDSVRSAFLTPLGDLTTRAGSGITDINYPTGIGGFPNTNDFVITQSSDGVAYGAVWMRYQSDANFEGWLPRYDPADPIDRSVDFVRPNRFAEARGVVIDPRRRDIFIVDAALDSVVKFDSRGRFRRESFGIDRTGGRMVRPVAAAFFDRTLYILDQSGGRILRFRLSTDLN